jgi:protein-L-isoaspartate(D-aspartate) O-methyltransferase
MQESYLIKGKRYQLVELLKKKGIKDNKILDAFNKVPRHLFVNKSMQHLAYENKPLSIGNKQTISQPFTVAFQTQLLELKTDDKVLEIGTGSGYQAAILAEIGIKNIFSVERIKELYENAKKNLEQLNYKVQLFYKDGYQGLPEFAPFDKIILTAAPPEIPKELLHQLSIEGIFVAPVGETGNYQKMVRIIRKSENKFITQYFGNFIFVPMKKGKE